MKANAYRSMAREEADHWYYRARCRAIARLLQRYVLPGCPDPRILDVGCGTGGTSQFLSQYGKLVGLEPSPLALELLRSRYPSLEVLPGGVDELPELVSPGTYDVATVLGTLYHRQVTDPQLALQQIADVLRDGGWVIWADCVYPWLARDHDDYVDGVRRFYPRQMHQMLRACELDVVCSAHLLSWGFPMALVLAGWHRWRRAAGRGPSETATLDERRMPRWANSLLASITYWEWRASCAGLKSPWGVSRLILARKRAALRHDHEICDRFHPSSMTTVNG